MTKETADQVSERNKKRLRLNRLLQEVQDLELTLRRRREALRFETAKIEQEAFREKRENTVRWLTPHEDELITEIRLIRKAVRKKEVQICDIVFDLGLEGVNL